ncbi:MAG: hypothetical protein H6867_03885 [Rhodospirillales bacterium]|nr:hypothetical protein [Rhodospirillales bacterium]MCB9996291.1 hypothetical protein [Rhodospirillales bacterium]
MAFRVIDNPDFDRFKAQSGFKNHQFKLLAGLFSRAASLKLLYDIAVDVDFDEGVCTFTYFKSNNYVPYLQFLIRRVGPQTDMYELYKEGKGRIAKSGLFERIYERLEEEVDALKS